MIQAMRQILFCGSVVLLSACSSTLPAEYRPQSFVTIGNSSAAMGTFTYAPASSGAVAPNQLQNTAVGSIFIGEDVARFVRRATALELQKAGLEIDDGARRRVHGDVLEFKIDDLGYSVDWSFAITYRIVDTESGKEVFAKTYRPEPRKTGKFGNPSDYTASLNLIILDAIERFMADVKRDGLLRSTTVIG